MGAPAAVAPSFWVTVRPGRNVKAPNNALVAADEAAINPGSGTATSTFDALRTRSHSVLLKQNSLSFLMGPPIEYPNWLRVYFRFGNAFALLSKSLAV